MKINKIAFLACFTVFLINYSATALAFDVKKAVKEANETRTRLKNEILVEQTAYQIWGDQSVNNLERLGLNSSDPKTALEKLSLTAQECIDRGFKVDTDKFGKCVLKIMEQASKSKPTVGTQTDTLSLKKAKEECAELGFKTGTEKYGECVMKLYD